MSVQTATTGPATQALSPDPPSAGEVATAWPVGSIARDIARGGLAGLIVGLLGAGVGGRIAMRLAALIVPRATGGFTENGNRIGDITAEGTFALLLVGIAFGLIAATVWVVTSPWIPGSGLRRALLAMPVAVGLGSVGLIKAENLDFFLLRRDPVVVAVLLALVAGIGFMFAVVDDWLDRRMPRARSTRSGAVAVYAVMSVFGGLLFLPITLGIYLEPTHPATVFLGMALIAVGAATLAWWVLRIRGRTQRPAALLLAGRGALLVAVLLGFAATATEISGALLLR